MPEAKQTQKLALTDDGVEVPDYLVGRTGVVTVEKPHLQMDITYVGDGVAKYDKELVTFPTTGKTGNPRIPEGHVRIDGTLYEIVDERTFSECPKCGSDKVSSCDDPVICYGCDTELDRPEDVNEQLTAFEESE